MYPFKTGKSRILSPVVWTLTLLNPKFTLYLSAGFGIVVSLPHKNVLETFIISTCFFYPRTVLHSTIRLYVQISSTVSLNLCHSLWKTSKHSVRIYRSFLNNFSAFFHFLQLLLNTVLVQFNVMKYSWNIFKERGWICRVGSLCNVFIKHNKISHKCPIVFFLYINSFCKASTWQHNYLWMFNFYTLILRLKLNTSNIIHGAASWKWACHRTRARQSSVWISSTWSLATHFFPLPLFSSSYYPLCH